MMHKENKETRILGISAYYHDSAAALLIDGDVVAAAHEERFTRKKNDNSFPKKAVSYVLSEYGLELTDLDAVVFYDKQYLKFERLLETYHAFAPRGLVSFLSAMPEWIKKKLLIRNLIWKELEAIQGKTTKKRPPLLFPEHHLSHAASAFYPSPFDKAAIITTDGVGEWATTTLGLGENNNISIIKETRFPHSLGLLYSAFTYYCGFKVNSGEYKLMGLAPYGHKNSDRTEYYKKLILGHLIDLKNDGSFLLDMNYFNFATGLRMCDDLKWTKLFGLPPRPAESEPTQEYMDMALAIQEITEEIMLRLAKTAKELTKARFLVMAGGVALNCVANARLQESGLFEDIWVQPAAGDAGGALGAALAAYYIWMGKSRSVAENEFDGMHGSLLGPEFCENDAIKVTRKYGAIFKKYDNFENLCEDAAEIISKSGVVGWFQGRMEWGPRALGNRSILGDPRNPEMQKKLNLKIKYREGFRPFAPSVLLEDVSEYFEADKPYPYMLFTTPVAKSRRKPLASKDKPLYERLYTPRSDIPSITHLDYSARPQTVSRTTNEPYWKIINAFKKKTGYGVIVNTSFNVRGEPIVCTPEDAFRCFMSTEMDYLVIGNLFFDKRLQPRFPKDMFNKIHGMD